MHLFDRLLRLFKIKAVIFPPNSNQPLRRKVMPSKNIWERAPSHNTHYTVLQQQGYTCDLIPFTNLHLVKNMRTQGTGNISLLDAAVFTKRQSYAAFFPYVHAYDRAMDCLRKRKGGAYAAYEKKLREQCIYKNGRYSSTGLSIDKLNKTPVVPLYKKVGLLKKIFKKIFFMNQQQRETYIPYNIQITDGRLFLRWLPITYNKKEESFSFINSMNDSEEPLKKISCDQNKFDEFHDKHLETTGNKSFHCRFTDKQIEKMGLTTEEFKGLDFKHHNPICKSDMSYYINCSTDPLYCKEVFFDLGIYQHMLLTMGVDKNNNNMTPKSPHYDAHKELQAEMNKDPLNPWFGIDKKDFFQYHIADIIKKNPCLKERLIIALSQGINTPWAFYQETFDYFDSANVKNKVPLKDKLGYLPGEEQMLAYYFSQELRLIWSATIDVDSTLHMVGLGKKINKLQKYIFRKFILTEMKSFGRKAFKARKGPASSFTFLELSCEILNLFKQKCKNELNGQKDFVHFATHGCIISIDSDLVKKQTHNDRHTAELLGVEYWDQLYDKNLSPFYRRLPHD